MLSLKSRNSGGSDRIIHENIRLDTMKIQNIARGRNEIEFTKEGQELCNYAVQECDVKNCAAHDPSTRIFGCVKVIFLLLC